MTWKLFDCITIVLGFIAIFLFIIAGVVLNNFSLIFVAIFICTPIHLFLSYHLSKKYDEEKQRNKGN